jgi:hypothetical protein
MNFSPAICAGLSTVPGAGAKSMIPGRRKWPSVEAVMYLYRCLKIYRGVKKNEFGG